MGRPAFCVPLTSSQAARNEVRISDLARGRLLRSRFATLDYRVSDLARGGLHGSNGDISFFDIYLTFCAF